MPDCFAVQDPFQRILAPPLPESVVTSAAAQVASPARAQGLPRAGASRGLTLEGAGLG